MSKLLSHRVIRQHQGQFLDFTITGNSANIMVTLWKPGTGEVGRRPHTSDRLFLPMNMQGNLGLPVQVAAMWIYSSAMLRFAGRLVAILDGCVQTSGINAGLPAKLISSYIAVASAYASSDSTRRTLQCYRSYNLEGPMLSCKLKVNA